MAGVRGPIVPRKRLAAELVRLRTEAGKTLDDVAHELMISASKLSRLENAQGSPQARDIRDLAVLYGVQGTPLGDKLTRWGAAGRTEGWWANYEEVVRQNSSFDQYLSYETDATIARSYVIPYITGLLQTADYTRALISAMDPGRPDREIERYIEVRAVRQQRLQRNAGTRPLELKAIIHECCLAQAVGPPTVMVAQLEALLEISDAPNVEVRVLSSNAQAHRMNSCTWSYFEFEDPLDRDVVQVETHAGFFQVENRDQVRIYDRAFKELERRCEDEAGSRALIERAKDRWKASQS